LDFFQANGHPVPAQTNPCEHYMDVLSRPPVINEIKMKAYDSRIAIFKEASGKSTMHATDFDRGLTDADELVMDVYKPSMGHTTWVLLLRSWRNSNRNFILMQFKFLVVAIFTVMTCSVYYGKIDHSTSDAVQAVEGCMFFLFTFVHVMSSVQAAAAMPLEKV
jgi:hypothetical protein